MMETVNILKESYQTALSCGKKEDNGKLVQMYKRMTKIERSGASVLRHSFTTTMDE